jgi:hypothetical protein
LTPTVSKMSQLLLDKAMDGDGDQKNKNANDEQLSDQIMCHKLDKNSDKNGK